MTGQIRPCGFGPGVLLDTGPCPEPVDWRLIIVEQFYVAKALEAFACSGHLAEAEHSAAGMDGGRAYTVKRITSERDR